MSEKNNNEKKVMIQKKQWWNSQAIWGGLASIVSGAGVIYGIDPETTKNVMEVTTAGMGAIGGGFMSIIGRWKAAMRIGK